MKPGRFLPLSYHKHLSRLAKRFMITKEPEGYPGEFPRVLEGGRLKR
jgi:hypothetical protein